MGRGFTRAQNMDWKAIVSRLKTFSPRHEAYIETLLRDIVEHYGDRLLVCAVFGSYARRENRLNSDLDLFLILDAKEGFTQRMARFVEHIEMKLDPLAQELYEREGILCEPSPYILMRDEARFVHPIYYDLVEYHVIVHDPHGLMDRIVRGVKAHLAESGARKEAVGTGWLWDVTGAKILKMLELGS
uniref:Nucleotidyltransferase domain-containing protein n=1 Tax=Desulfacinum infernum TaxID=35837 RepID=A0A832A763_9BACT